MVSGMFDAGMSPPIPRYAAPERSRQRLRLLVAVGLLVGTALAIAGLARMFSGEPEDERTTSEVGEPRAEVPDAIAQLEREVELAEQATARARTALHQAQLRRVDPIILDALERRLDALGSIRPSEPTPGSVALGQPEESTDLRRRSGSRTPAESARDL